MDFGQIKVYHSTTHERAIKTIESAPCDKDSLEGARLLLDIFQTLINEPRFMLIADNMFDKMSVVHNNGRWQVIYEGLVPKNKE